MAIGNDYSGTLTLGRLYKVGLKVPTEKLYRRGEKASLYFKGGTVSVYGSDSNTEPTALSDMSLSAENTGVAGVQAFSYIPKYIAIVQASGTTTEITSFGIEFDDLGAIS
jgi:hypothetical protein